MKTITYKRLHYTKDELMEQFTKACVKINKVSQEILQAKDNHKQVMPHEL